MDDSNPYRMQLISLVLAFVLAGLAELPVLQQGQSEAQNPMTRAVATNDSDKTADSDGAIPVRHAQPPGRQHRSFICE